MRTRWIVACALATIGAFFVVLQLLWWLHVEPDWLPYPVQLLGGVLAGATMASSSPPRSLREPLVGGLLGVVVLAVVSLALPAAFTLTAARIDQRWLVLPILVATTGLACAGGAWLFGHTERASPPRASVAALAMLTSACTMLLGARVELALGMPVGVVELVAAATLAAFAAGAATQAVVAVASTTECMVGVAALVVFAVIQQLRATHDTVELEPSTLLMLAPIFAAGLGARAAR